MILERGTQTENALVGGGILQQAGSKVKIRCSYSHPSRIKGLNVAVEQRFWFTKVQDGKPVDLRAASEYTGRVKYDCRNKACTLTITDLRDSDSAVYQFRFTTNLLTGSFTGSPGVSLSVTGVQVIITKSSACRTGDCSWSSVECQTSCPPTPSLSYTWYKNGKKTSEKTSYTASFYSADSISCAVRGHEDFPSATVYAPKVPLVQLSQPGDILKDSSVSLTCSSDANPAANYTWYKGNQTLLNRAAQLVFSSILLSDSGEYYCTAENALGKTASKRVLINMKYAPKPPSVSVSPSGEIMEGSSVTLTCSSDANPAAHYTWYKEDEDSPTASGQNFTITDIKAEHGGKYQCEAQNTHGRSNTTLHLSVRAVVQCENDWDVSYTSTELCAVRGSTVDITLVRSQIDWSVSYTSTDVCAFRGSTVDINYAPKPPSVSVSPSGEIMEGSSVTLTCSSDANPAAKYTWYKRSGGKQVQRLSEETQFVLSSIRSSDSGEYYCTAENELGRSSANIFITVTYAPKPPSVSVSPSGEIMEGSSVTLTCSSDANPAAHYTWYKEDEDSTKATGQNFTITNITAEHGGKYQCEAQNTHGRSNTTLHLTVGAGKSVIIMNIIRLTLVVVLVPVLVWTLWTRMKKTLSLKSEVNEAVEMIELDNSREYDDIAAAAQTEDTEEQEDLV
ncbi:B-cell receptor CD22-like [Limanda limanda]|uniref:B-cell receptor CD22-like n=1 Tax=Limanda limanda TaxID=27771 RepID=UPI0029C7DA5C|nr:B-cell receptor CD22-like [Limanda limanda]